MIVTVIQWAAFTACALLAASGLWQMARTRGASRDPGRWHAPLIFTSAAVALLAALGVLAPLPGAFLASAALSVTAARSARLWREAAKTRLGKAGAARLVLSLLWGHVRAALLTAGADLRVLAGSPPECADAPAPAPVIARPRREASTARPEGRGCGPRLLGFGSRVGGVIRAGGRGRPAAAHRREGRRDPDRR